MRLLTAMLAAALLFATAVGCHEKKNEPTTPSGTMGDGGTTQSHPVYPPAQ
jgi:hypothetical protein